MNMLTVITSVLQRCSSSYLRRVVPTSSSSTGVLGDEAYPQRDASTSLSELTELGPALGCSIITTSYIIQAESARECCPLNIDTFQSASQILLRAMRLDFLQNISPGLALGSCLVLGCCLSSYVHRRRDQDQYQPVLFVIWILWAICIGWGIGASLDVVTLGIVPWASCAAMLSSFSAHAGARWVLTRQKCNRFGAPSAIGETQLCGPPAC